MSATHEERTGLSPNECSRCSQRLVKRVVWNPSPQSWWIVWARQAVRTFGPGAVMGVTAAFVFWLLV